jgi:VCBS repeat-containing protein
VTCTATDHAGNTAATTFTVTRAALEFSGFLAPIGGADSTGGSFSGPLRAFKVNSTIPVKFTLSCGGAVVTTGVHTLRAVKYSNQTTADAAVDATPQGAATTGNVFVLHDGHWQFNLDTKATGMSIGIWQLLVTLSDGSEHRVWIQVK